MNSYLVDRVWAVELQREKRTLRQQVGVIRAVRREQLDVAFNFSGADRTLFMTALTGAKSKVGLPGGRQHFWNAWLIRNWAPRQDLDMIVFAQRRRTLAACGVPLGPVRFSLKLDPAAMVWAEGVVPRFAMHVSLNSSKATREWPLEHHVAMCSRSVVCAPGAAGGDLDRGKRESANGSTLSPRC